MTFEIDPAFRNSREKARQRRNKRLALRIGGGLTAGILVALLAVWILGPGGDPVQELAQQDSQGEEGENGFDDFAMIQTEDAAAPEIRRDPRASFIDLARDPMILRIQQADAGAIRKLAGPPAFLPERVGGPGSERLSLLQDALFVGEKRLITTLPSSRDDFALFQAQRSRAIAEMQSGRVEAPPRPTAPVEAGQVVRVEEEGSWGSFIAGDKDDDTRQAETAAAVYVETRIENTTSVALALRESQRFGLYEDVIVVLQTDRALDEVLQSNGFTAERAGQISQAAERQLSVTGPLTAGSIVALRLRPDVTGKVLMQMSLYAPDGYLASLAQVGAGRFEPSADPWLQDDLLARSGQIRQTAVATQEVRLLDALYSAAIRNGLSTKLVGELIVIMSQRFDLDRFVAEGDEVTILFASDPGPKGQGLGQLLFVGISGPSGDMPCYVVESDSASGFGCFDFSGSAAGGGAGGLGGGLLVPVNGVKTSGFGPRHHPILNQVRNHNGVDWAAPTGTPIVAVADGKVNYAGVAGGYGNVVYLDHSGGVQTRYAHMHKFGDGIRTGSSVAAGQVIGYVGTTGRSTGPHLHFELRVAGAPVDPLTYGGVSTGGQPGSQAVEALVNQIIRVESAGNARAKNPRSTATGLGQFIESTWLRMMRDYRPDLVKQMGRAQLLELRFDPALSREMVRNLARENESFLRARGHQITAGRLYLAHFLGPSGAHTALAADPSKSVLEVMGAAVVNANPFLRGKTIADLRAWSDRKMRGAGRGGGTAIAAAVPRVIIPPEVKAFRKTVDEVLAAL